MPVGFLPFCNVLTANISTEGFDSFSVTQDDNCGASFRDGLYGAFFFNPGFDPAGNVGGGRAARPGTLP